MIPAISAAQTETTCNMMLKQKLTSVVITNVAWCICVSEEDALIFCILQGDMQQGGRE